MPKRPNPKTIHEKQLLGKNKWPMYPIEYAINYHDPKLLQSFIDAGADSNMDLGNECTPLHMAVALYIDAMIQDYRLTFSPEEVKIFKVLLRNKADLNKRNKEGERPLDQINFYSADRPGFDALVDLFRPFIRKIDNFVAYAGDE